MNRKVGILLALGLDFGAAPPDLREGWRRGQEAVGREGGGSRGAEPPRGRRAVQEAGQAVGDAAKDGAQAVKEAATEAGQKAADAQRRPRTTRRRSPARLRRGSGRRPHSHSIVAGGFDVTS